MATEDKWTSRKASLQLVSLMLEFGLVNEMERVLEEVVRSQLEHEEPRVRLQAAETLGRAAQTLSSRTRLWSHFSQPLMSLIHDYEERLPVSFADGVKRSSESAVFQPAKGDEVRHATEGWGPLESSLRALLHIIQGYYANPFEESATNASSTPQEFHTLFPITQELMETLIRMTNHQNRFVRETSFLALSALFEGEEKRIAHQRRSSLISSSGAPQTGSAEPSSSITVQAGPSVPFMDYLKRMAMVIREGMMDDWSHVVLGASGACRSLLFFLRSLAFASPSTSILSSMEELFSSNDGEGSAKEAKWLFDAFEVLLPALCLNRYTSAEGLRNYTLGTWKRVVLNDGPRLVSLFLQRNVLPFYLECLQSHNAATRETASYCLGELVQKIPKARGDGDDHGDSDSDDDDDDGKKPSSSGGSGNPDDFGVPKIPREIDESLRRMTHDASWPVRDASLSSLSLLILNINANSLNDIDLSSLISAIEERLNDPLASVRQTASTALISFLERMIEDEIKDSSTTANETRNEDGTVKVTKSASRPPSMAQKLKVKHAAKDPNDDGDDSDSDSDDDGPKDGPTSGEPIGPSGSSGPKISKFVNYIIQTIEDKLRLFLQSGVVQSESTDTPSHPDPHNHHHHHKHSHGHSGHHEKKDDQVSKHVLETGEDQFGPLSKLRHDNDPEIHKEQEIFGCECHSTPHTCKAHPLTSKKREIWEISQSALFLLSSLVRALTENDNPEAAAQDPSKKRGPSSAQRKVAIIAPFLPKLLSVTSLAAQLLRDTKRLFDKYGTWQTSLVETLEKILKDASGVPTRLFPVPALRYILPSGENTPHTDSAQNDAVQSWKSTVPVLFRIIAAEEQISTTVVSRGTMPMGAGPGMPVGYRGPLPGGPGMVGGFPLSSMPSSSQPFLGAMGGPAASPFALNPATMNAAAPSYAASIKPSVARASASMLLIDACASLLVALHTTFGSTFVLDGHRSEAELSIFKRKCEPIISGAHQRDFPF